MLARNQPWIAVSYLLALVSRVARTMRLGDKNVRVVILEKSETGNWLSIKQPTRARGT